MSVDDDEHRGDWIAGQWYDPFTYTSLRSNEWPENSLHVALWTVFALVAFTALAVLGVALAVAVLGP